MANKSGQTHDLWTRTRGWKQGPQQLVVPDTHGKHNRARLEDRAIVQGDRISLCRRLKDETRCVTISHVILLSDVPVYYITRRYI